MRIMQSRRRFIAGLSAAGTAGLMLTPKSLTRSRPRKRPRSVCRGGSTAPTAGQAQYIAGELLRAEGFTDVRYVEADSKVDQSVWIARGDTDFDVNFVPRHVASIDAGVPIKVLTGLHSGCLELIANESIRSITDLRGKRVGVDSVWFAATRVLTLMVAYVGLDPVNDIQWVLTEGATPKELFVEGKIDAFLGTPPRPQALRAEKIGRTILNTALDRPWSQYFCCMVSARADYVEQVPGGDQACPAGASSRPPISARRIREWVARQIGRCAVSSPAYDYALQTLNEIRYDRWRDFDPEDSLRFYALRMQETGLIKSSPNKIIAEGTDWRFLNELKRELKT